jgi:hypothetical protein
MLRLASLAAKPVNKTKIKQHLYQPILVQGENKLVFVE